MRRHTAIAALLLFALSGAFAAGVGVREYLAFRTLSVMTCDGTPIALNTRRGSTLGVNFFVGGSARGPVKISIATRPGVEPAEEAMLSPQGRRNRISFSYNGEWYGDFVVGFEGEDCRLTLAYRFDGSPLPFF